jgi:hypothetical protein
MIYNEPEESFICPGCGKLTREYYRSIYDTELCIFCDTEGDYDDDYPEDDSESPYNE